jgi:hypothetical protein
MRPRQQSTEDRLGIPETPHNVDHRFLEQILERFLRCDHEHPLQLRVHDQETEIATLLHDLNQPWWDQRNTTRRHYVEPHHVLLTPTTTDGMWRVEYLFRQRLRQAREGV